MANRRRLNGNDKKIVVVLVSVLLLNCLGCSSNPQPIQCQDALGCLHIGPEMPVVIGVIQTMSGGSAPGGMEQVHSIQLAVSKRNNQLLGHSIQLKLEDEKCSAEGGANAALRIVADPQVAGILGTNCSSAAVAAGQIMTEKGLVMISSANTSPALTAIGGKQGSNWVPGYFRTSWNDTAMGEAAATFAITKLGLTHAAVINAGDAYTKGLTDVFSQVFIQMGGKVVMQSIVDEAELDQHPVVEAIAQSEAELVFFPLSSPESGSRIIKQAREDARLDQVAFITGEGMLSNVFIQNAGEAGVGVYILGPAEPETPETENLREEYQSMFGEPPPSFYHSFSVDATNLLLDSIQKIAHKESDGSLSIGRQALRDTLYATKDYPGLTGLLSCDQFGDCGVARLNIVQLIKPGEKLEELRANIVYTYWSKQ